MQSIFDQKVQFLHPAVIPWPVQNSRLRRNPHFGQNWRPLFVCFPKYMNPESTTAHQRCWIATRAPQCIGMQPFSNAFEFVTISCSDKNLTMISQTVQELWYKHPHQHTQPQTDTENIPPRNATLCAGGREISPSVTPRHPLTDVQCPVSTRGQLCRSQARTDRAQSTVLTASFCRAI